MSTTATRARRPDPADQPPYLYEPYKSTLRRAPAKPLIFLPHTLSERSGPIFGPDAITETDHDLTRQHAGEPVGQRMILTGRVVDEDGRPVRNTLVEIWQTNAAGRYRHRLDDFRAPLDPNFTGTGRTLTDNDGNYRFITVSPALIRGRITTTPGVRRTSTSRCSGRRFPPA